NSLSAWGLEGRAIFTLARRIVFKCIAIVVATAGLLLLMPGSNSESVASDIVIQVAAEGVVLYPNELTIDVTVMVDGEVVPEPELTWQLQAGPGPTSFMPSRTGVDVSFPMPGTFDIDLTVEVDGVMEHRAIRVSVYVP